MTEETKVRGRAKVAREALAAMLRRKHRTRVLDITRRSATRHAGRRRQRKASFSRQLAALRRARSSSSVSGGALVGDLKSPAIETPGGWPRRDGCRHGGRRHSDCERGSAQLSPSRAALLGRSVAVGISGGELSLGRFQSILFAELDGPRPRSIDVQIMGV